MKALLVIDIQTRFIKDANAFEEERFIKVVNSSIEVFQKKGDLVIYVHHLKGDVLPGTPGWEFDERIIMDNKAPFIWKSKGNAFDGTELKSILDKHKIKEITLCGLVTQNCIRSTGIGCVEEGYKTILLKNGTTNWTDNPQKTIDEVERELESLGVIIK
mgnify:CR=1 FL=1